ncbi:MAG: hypothetical protein AAGM67_21100, partial [Bacteroidota bacterium]
MLDVLQSSSEVDQFTCGVIGYFFKEGSEEGETPTFYVVIASVYSLANICRSETIGRLAFFADATYDPCFESTFKVLSMGVPDSNAHTNLVSMCFSTDESSFGFAFQTKAVIRATEWLFSRDLSFQIDALDLSELREETDHAPPSEYYCTESSVQLREFF